MKKIITTSALALTAIMYTGCAQTVDAGSEGVVITKPWIFGHGGVDSTPVSTGLVWTAPSTDIVTINIKPFNINESFGDLITKDNNPVTFDIHMTFQHQEGKTPILLQHFGDAWYSGKIQQPLRNDVRNFVKGYTMFEISTDPVIADELQKVVEAKVRMFITKEKIPTQLLNVSVGKVLPPKTVIDATLETAAQKQRILTQEARVQAEHARKIAEEATAEADKAYMNKMGMTPQQYLQNKQLDIIAVKPDVKVFLGSTPQPMVNGD